MLRFLEGNEKDWKKFAKLVYDFFWDEEKDWFDFYGRRFDMVKKIEGWPEKLDLENFEVNSVGVNYISFVAGGDWQEMVPVTLCKHFTQNKLVFKPFDAQLEMTSRRITDALRDLAAMATGEGAA